MSDGTTTKIGTMGPFIALKKSGEVEQILPCLYWSDADVYHSRREQRGAVGSSQSGLT